MASTRTDMAAVTDRIEAVRERTDELRSFL